MNSRLVILGTGSRTVRDLGQATDFAQRLFYSEIALRGPENLHLVHGAAVGWDTVLRDVARELGVSEEGWAANLFPTPLVRNHFLSDLVVRIRDNDGFKAVCWTFASKWASGTGHCARAARDKGIITIDYGADTRRKDQR